jgi:hypothetical protein
MRHNPARCENIVAYTRTLIALLEQSIEEETSVSSKLSYNVVGIGDAGKLMAHLLKIQPKAALFYGQDIEFARAVKSALPDTAVLIRHWPDENAWHTPPLDYVNRYAPTVGSDLYLVLNNESGFSQEFLDWTLAVMKLCVERKVHAAVLNLNTGTPKPEEWPKARAILELASQHSELFVVSLHEYAGAVVTSGLYGGWPDNAGVAPGQSGGKNLIPPENWPKSIDGVTAFHMGRYHFLLSYCKSIGLKPPRIIITESGFDTTGDILGFLDKQPRTPPYSSLSGWKTLVNAWKRFWPQWTAMQAYFNQIRYAIETYYQDAEAVLVFGWVNGGEWDFDDLSQQQEWQDALEAYVSAPAPTPAPVPQPVPVPEPTPQAALDLTEIAKQVSIAQAALDRLTDLLKVQ